MLATNVAKYHYAVEIFFIFIVLLYVNS